MTKIKTAELSLDQLDCIVAKCEGRLTEEPTYNSSADLQILQLPCSMWARFETEDETEEYVEEVILVKMMITTSGTAIVCEIGTGEGTFYCYPSFVHLTKEAAEYAAKWSNQGGNDFHPSTNIAEAYGIIEREKIDTSYCGEGIVVEANEVQPEHWYADMYWRGQDQVPGGGETWRAGGDGATMMEAAMRCYVASKMGEEVDVPEGV